MVAYFFNLIQYTKESNNSLFESIKENAPHDERILKLAAHIPLAQKIWWHRIQQEPSKISVWETLAIEEIINLNNDTSHNLMQYLNLITESDLSTTLTYHNLAGEIQEKKLETIIQHLAFHASYHRGQIALLLKSYMPNIPSTDYIKFSLEL